MILALLVVMLLVLPAVLVGGVWAGRHGSRAEWLLAVLATTSYLLYIVLAGRWDYFSYALRIIVPVALVIAIARSWPKVQQRPWMRRPRFREMPGLVVMMLLLAAFTYTDAQALSGYTYRGEALRLAFPLRAGVYYVGGGGANRFINNHQAYPPQAYALDILRLNAWGARARGINPAELTRYAIFGDTVFAPCSGPVLVAVDGLADIPIGERDKAHLAGNHVVLGCGGAKVVLAHLLRGSVQIQAGEQVRTGQTLGRIGNSGNTSEPHLHIHVERGGEPAGILTGVGVPALYDGRFLVRNSLVWRRR
jgi:hypothetical protein